MQSPDEAAPSIVPGGSERLRLAKLANVSDNDHALHRLDSSLLRGAHLNATTRTVNSRPLGARKNRDRMLNCHVRESSIQGSRPRVGARFRRTTHKLIARPLRTRLLVAQIIPELWSAGWAVDESFFGNGSIRTMRALFPGPRAASSPGWSLRIGPPDRGDGRAARARQDAMSRLINESGTLKCLAPSGPSNPTRASAGPAGALAIRW